MARTADPFLRLFDPAELQKGHPTRLRRWNAVTHFVRDRHFDESLKFIAQLLFDGVPVECTSHDRREPMHENHVPSSTLVTANVALSQRCRLCSRCRFPDAVSL